MDIYKNRESASLAAAEQIAQTLQQAVSRQGSSSLAVSGGLTPMRCLTLLGQQSLPWQQIGITLTDERDAPLGHCDRNETMLRDTLLDNPEVDRRFIRLDDPALPDLLPLTCALVGMGEDGHFASIFADSPQLDVALTSTNTIEHVGSRSHAYTRVTLTLHALQATDLILLLVFGEEKRLRLEKPAGYPIEHLLALPNVEVIWAP